MIPGPEQRWITVNATAIYLGVHPLTIRDWIAKGLVPACRIGRAVRIDLKALEKRLEDQLSAKGIGK